jgi:hypothetical protein
MTREREVRKTAQICNELYLHNQFLRLINGNLNSDEDFDTVYDQQLTLRLSQEDYGKCIKLRELVRREAC